MSETDDEDFALHPMADLRGTEKQVAWASKIRETKFREMRLHVTKYLLSLGEGYQNSAWLEFRDKIAFEIGNITESSFWIDNRHKKAVTIFGYWPHTLSSGGNFHRGPKGGRGRRL